VRLPRGEIEFGSLYRLHVVGLTLVGSKIPALSPTPVKLKTIDDAPVGNQLANVSSNLIFVGVAPDRRVSGIIDVAVISPASPLFTSARSNNSAVHDFAAAIRGARMTPAPAVAVVDSLLALRCETLSDVKGYGQRSTLLLLRLTRNPRPGTQRFLDRLLF
jgi:hypothetical protein